jgi:hypothetical protein
MSLLRSLEIRPKCTLFYKYFAPDGAAEVFEYAAPPRFGFFSPDLQYVVPTALQTALSADLLHISQLLITPKMGGWERENVLRRLYFP